MAIFEFELCEPPRDLSIYTIARSLTEKSTMELRKSLADGIALVQWDTDDFPLTTKRTDHYADIRTAVEKLISCNCKYHLLYRCAPMDSAEIISYDQMCNLLAADLEYEKQEHD